MYIAFHFVRNPAWYAIGSRIIQKVQGIPYSHFALEYSYDPDHKGVIVESVFPKSRMISHDFWHYEIVESFWWEIPKELEPEMRRWINSQIGKSYSVSQLVFIFITGMSKKLGKLFNKSILNGKTELICTELGFYFAQHFWSYKTPESSDKIDLLDMRKIALEYKGKNNMWRKP